MYQIYLPAPKYIPRPNASKSLFAKPNDIHQSDLLSLPHDKFKKKTYKYALNIVDVASKYKGSYQLTTKNAKEVAQAFQWIYENTPLNYPNTLIVDDGKEFYGDTTKLMEKHDVIVQHGDPSHHRSQGIVERFNRMLADRLFTYQYHRELEDPSKSNREWVSRLQNVVSSLNNEKTRLIGMKPVDAIKQTLVEQGFSQPTKEYEKRVLNFLSLSILLLLPFTLLCLTNDVAFNVEFSDCKQSFLYHKRNLYSTNIFYYKRLQYKVFNNNISILIHSLPISGIAYKLGGDFPSNNFTHKIHYKLGPEAHTIKLVFFPLLFIFMVTISNWIMKETFSYYTNIKHIYLFLKSRRHFRKHGMLFVFQKVLLFLLVVLTFDAKLPSRTQNDLNTAVVKDNELFTIRYITTADVIRSNHIKNQSSLYALTKLKFSKHHSYFKYLLILSGDINLHPGPVKYPCSVCAKLVRKRIISCEKCGLWLHKKCDPTFKLENNSSSICKPCQNKLHDNLYNVWVEFPFDDDFFRDKETASFDEKINDDAYKTDPVASWKAFNKRGLHLIHLNINSLLSKIDELQEIARKTRATVIGITESKLDGSVLDGEINIDGYKLVRSDRNRHGGGVACYIRNDISFSVRGDFSSEIENIFLDILLPKTKPILIGILYRPPDQSKFLDNLSTSISQTCSFNEEEVYILGDLNINLINSQKHTPNGIK